MGLRQEIAKALRTPFDATAQGLDPTEYRAVGVWHDGPTLEESWIKITRELNLETGSFTDGEWIPSEDPTLRTNIDILDKKGTGKGELKDINNLKKKFNKIRKLLPPGEYWMNADNPRKAGLYKREWSNLPEFRMSGEEAQGRYVNKFGETVKGRFETMIMTVPEGPPDLTQFSRKGGQAAREAQKWGLDEWIHSGELVSKYEGRWTSESQKKKRQWSFKRESLGQEHSRLESQLRKEGKRHRGLEHSSPEEAELSWLKKKEIMKYNADNNLKPGDPLYRRIEHRIQIANHDFWNSPLGKSMGKPDDGWNIIWTNKAQYDAKGSLEAKLKGFPYVVDVEPVSGNLRVIGFDEFNRNFDAHQGLEIGLDADMKETAFGFKTEAEEKALKQLDFEKRSVGAAGRDFPLAPSSGRGMLQRRLGAVLPVVGAGFDAWDVKARLAEARANPDNKLDQLQLGIASATLGTSFWAEPANFALGMTNLGIDAYRTITEEDKREDFLKSMRAIGRGGTKIGKQVTNLL